MLVFFFFKCLHMVGMVVSISTTGRFGKSIHVRGVWVVNREQSHGLLFAYLSKTFVDRGKGKEVGTYLKGESDRRRHGNTRRPPTRKKNLAQQMKSKQKKRKQLCGEGGECLLLLLYTVSSITTALSCCVFPLPLCPVIFCRIPFLCNFL